MKHPRRSSLPFSPPTQKKLLVIVVGATAITALTQIISGGPPSHVRLSTVPPPTHAPPTFTVEAGALEGSGRS